MDDKAKITIKIPVELHREFKRKCLEKNTNQTKILKSYIEKFTEQRESNA